MKFSPIARKDLKVLLKDKAAIVVLFILPIMFISIMSFALKPVYSGGTDSAVEILLVRQDPGPEADKFVQALGDVKGLMLTVPKGELSAEAAEKQVNDGDYPMALVIPADFGAKVAANEKATLLSFEDPAQANTTSVIVTAIEGVSRSFSMEFTIAHMVEEQVVSIRSTFDTKLEEIDAAYSERLQAALQQVSAQTGGAVTSPAVEPAAGGEDVDYDAIQQELVGQAQQALVEPSISVKSTFDGGDRAELPDAFQQNVPGYTVMFAFFIVMFAGRSFIQERQEGTFRRILSAPVAKWSLFLGKMAPNYLIGLMQAVVMFSFGHFVFGMSLGNSLLGLLAISLCMIWASTTLGMMIAALVRTESQVTGLSMLIILTLAALGGTMVPLFIMPDIMQKIAMITPHAWALSGYQDLLVRGMGFTDVIVNMLALLGFGAFFVLISIWRMRFDD